MQVDFTITTSGTSLWGGDEDISPIKPVRVIKFECNVETCGAPEMADLWVYFDPTTWSVEHDGLIYTDQPWLEQLCEELDKLGLVDGTIEYSENGEQGTGDQLDTDGVAMEDGHFVHFLVDPEFIANYRRLNPDEDIGNLEQYLADMAALPD